MKRKKILVYVVPFICVSAGIYYAKPHILNLYDILCDNVINIAGFKVKRIDIQGASLRVEKMIRKRIRLQEGSSVLAMPSSEIHRRVSSISWIKSASVKKNLPNVIKISVVEAIPVAIYQQGGKSMLIDEEGTFLEGVTAKFPGLPLVAGKNSHKNVATILKKLSEYQDIKERIESLCFVRERRWDMVISGIKIKLPEKNIDEALSTIANLFRSGKISRNSLSSIDLSIPGNVIIGGLKLKRNNSV